MRLQYGTGDSCGYIPAHGLERGQRGVKSQHRLFVPCEQVHPENLADLHLDIRWITAGRLQHPEQRSGRIAQQRVPAPRGTMGRPAWWIRRTVATTSSVERGKTTALGIVVPVDAEEVVRIGLVRIGIGNLACPVR